MLLAAAVLHHLQPARRQHRRQREADDERDEDGERHCQAETLHETADDAAHEADGHENRHERQGRCEHGEPDFLRGVDRRAELILVLLFDESIDVLQHHDCVVDDDADRKRKRQHGHEVQREAHVPDEPEGRDDRRGNRNRRNDRRAQVAQEEEHDQRGENRSDDEMLFDVVNSRLDEIGCVADHACVVTGWQLTLQLVEPLHHIFDDFHRIRARLPAYLEEHGAGAIHVGNRFGLRLAVFDARDVAHAHLMSVLLADHHVGELRHGLYAAARAQGHRLRALIHAPAGDFDVLLLQRSRDVGHRQVVGAQAIGVEPDVDLPRPSTNDEHLPDARHAFELAAQHLVGILGDVAQRLVRAERETEHWRRIGIEAVDTRLLHGLGQERQDAVDLVAYLLRGHIRVFLQQEADHDLRDPLRGCRAQLVDAADRVDGFLDLVADFGFDLLRRGTGLHRRHDDPWEVDFRKLVDAEQREGEEPDDREREDEDGREDRPFDAQRG